MTTSALKQFLDASKHETRILGPVQRMLLKELEEDRETDHLHPSEVCKDDWCPRSSYYRITKAPALEQERVAFALQRVYENGHEIHDKWQNWLWRAGTLEGMWECLHCDASWWDTAPEACPQGHPRRYVRYREVPLHDDEHRLLGHADGKLGGSLLEVKSIGPGTLRFDAPDLLKTHTHKFEGKTLVDFETLWREIRRPFSQHVRQAQLYLLMSGLDEVVFLYELKSTQATKEFVVPKSTRQIAQVLDSCKDVVHALSISRVPTRPPGFVRDAKPCTTCPYREVCWQSNDNEHRPGPGHRRRPGQGRTPAAGAPDPGQADLHPAPGPAERGRPAGLAPDEPVRPTHSLHRLLVRRGGAG